MSTENPLNEFDGLTPADRELEGALGALRPVETSLMRDAMLFEAGRRSARRPVRFWQSVAALMAVGTGVALFLPGRGVPGVDRGAGPSPVVVVEPLKPERMKGAAPRGRDEFAYLELRSQVLAEGVDALPTAPSTDRTSTYVPTIGSRRFEQP